MTKDCVRGVVSPTIIPIYKKGKMRSNKPNKLCGEHNGTPNQRKTHVVHGKPLKQERTGTEPATPKQERDPQGPSYVVLT